MRRNNVAVLLAAGLAGCGAERADVAPPAAVRDPWPPVSVSADTVVVGGARYVGPGIESASILQVPLRTDLSEWALTIRSGGWVRLLAQSGDSVRVLWTGERPPQMRYQTRNYQLWVVDADGDGTNELVVDAWDRSDIGPEYAGRSIFRRDSASGLFTEQARGLSRFTARYRGGAARREAVDVAASLETSAPLVEVWHETDGSHAVVRRQDVLEPWSIVSGTMVAQLVYARRTARDTVAEAFLVISSTDGPSLPMSWRSLGGASLKAAATCPRGMAERATVRLIPAANRPGFRVSVSWMPDSLTLATRELELNGGILFVAQPQPDVTEACPR